MKIRTGVSAAAGAALAAGALVAGAGAAGAVTGPSAAVADNTLTITGTAGGDSVSLGVPDSTAPNALVVDFGNGSLPQSFDRNTFTAVAVFLGRGDDTFTVFSAIPFSDDALTVDGQGGNDAITGGPGNDHLDGGAGIDTIRGGSGDDIISGDGGDDVVDGGPGTDTELLGAGEDTALWNPGEGSDVVNGGADADTLQFNGSNIGETMSLSANGTRAVLLRDVAQIRMDLANLEQVDVAAIGGADSFAVNDLTGTAVAGVKVNLASSAGTGDGAIDTVTVRGTAFDDAVDVSADTGDVLVGGLRASVRISGAETE